MCEVKFPVLRNLSTSCHLAAVMELPAYPYTFTTPDNKSFNGILKTLMDIYVKKYGECFDVRILNDGCNGAVFYPNGSLSGIYGLTAKGIIDMVFSVIAVTYERSRVLGFSTVDRYGSSVVYKYPELAPDITGFIKPFTWQVWLILFIGLVVITTTFSAFSVSTKSKNMIKYLCCGQLNIGASFMNSMAILLGQSGVRMGGHGHRFTKIDVDLLTFSLWLLCTFIISLVYKCNLVAMLTAPKLVLPFTSLEEMLSQKTLPYTVPKGTLIDTLAKTAPRNSLLGRLNATMIPAAYMASKNVSKGEVAVIAIARSIEGSFHRDFSQWGHCVLTYLNEQIFESDQALSFPKNSSLKPKFDAIITGLREFGILSHWVYDIWMPNATHCMNPSRNVERKLRTLNLEDMYGVMCLLLGGYVLSILVFTCEILVRKITKKS